MAPSENQACEARDFAARLPCLLGPFIGLPLYKDTKQSRRKSVWLVLVALVLPDMVVQEALSLTFESLPCTGGDLLRAQLLGRRPVIDFPYTRKPRAAPCCGRQDQRAEGRQEGKNGLFGGPERSGGKGLPATVEVSKGRPHL